MNNQNQKDITIGQVQKFLKEGPHGPYLVIKIVHGPKQLLEKIVTAGTEYWKEEHLPSMGAYVVVDELEYKDAGWRCYKIRRLKPEEEQILKN